ncbi:hypothetical protein GCM10025868_20810 [Angustibacter aerolatus]|uniref:EAL domain-containing protein n=1 Tax=Angustibacter aerolatus TaxID=1162965 RepID=A0ABQ6JF46_9ACTN|nr:hypothetical protein GCM10025868_20810 [Angustibacter aerolatus]
MLRSACTTAAAWPSDEGRLPSISVNVSPLQVTDLGFAEEVRSALRDSGLDPARIFLEITENAAVEDWDETAARLRGLRRLGVKWPSTTSASATRRSPCCAGCRSTS